MLMHDNGECLCVYVCVYVWLQCRSLMLHIDTYKGCFQDSYGVKDLTGPFDSSYSAMTLKRCSEFCAGYDKYP